MSYVPGSLSPESLNLSPCFYPIVPGLLSPESLNLSPCFC